MRVQELPSLDFKSLIGVTPIALYETAESGLRAAAVNKATRRFQD